MQALVLLNLKTETVCLIIDQVQQNIVATEMFLFYLANILSLGSAKTNSKK